MSKPIRYTILTVTAAIVVTSILAIVFYNRLSHQGLSRVDGSDPTKQSSQYLDEYTGSRLSLPFNIADISSTHGGINPLGVVRFDADRADLGHSGIDVPLKQDAPIYAVADGEIVHVKLAQDEWGGQSIGQLVDAKNSDEGWVFVYEHVASNVEPGQKVKVGDVVGYKIAPESFTAHFQFSYAFNNYEFYQGMECWPDYLSTTSSQTLNQWWNSRIKAGIVAENWTGEIQEGSAPFEKLLNSHTYPDGPKLCYTPGTDVR